MLRVRRREPVYVAGVGVLALSLLLPSLGAQAAGGGATEPSLTAVSTVEDVNGSQSSEVQPVESTQPAESSLSDNGESGTEALSAPVPEEAEDTTLTSTGVETPVTRVTDGAPTGETATRSADAADPNKQGTIRGRIVGLTKEQLRWTRVWSSGEEVAPAEDGSFELKVAEGFTQLAIRPLVTYDSPKFFMPEQRYAGNGRTVAAAYGARALEVHAGHVIDLGDISVKTYGATLAFKSQGRDSTFSRLDVFEILPTGELALHRSWDDDNGVHYVPVISRDSKFFLQGKTLLEGEYYTAKSGSKEEPFSAPEGVMALNWVKVQKDEPSADSLVPVSIHISSVERPEECVSGAITYTARASRDMSCVENSDGSYLVKGTFPKGYGKDAYRYCVRTSSDGTVICRSVFFEVKDQPVSIRSSISDPAVDVQIEGSAWLDRMELVPVDFVPDPFYHGIRFAKENYDTTDSVTRFSAEDVSPGKYLLRHSWTYEGSGTPNLFYTAPGAIEPYVITVPEGVTTFNPGIRWVLPEPGVISGTVRAAETSAPLTATRIDAYQWKGERWNKVSSTSDWGHYTLLFLEPGKYTLGFSNPYIFDDLYGVTDQNLEAIPSPSTYPYCAQFLGGKDALDGVTVLDVKPGQVTQAPDVYLKKCENQKIAAGDVRISGDAVAGKTLTVIPGTWQPDMVQLDYQWLADGQPIAGATAKELSLTESLVGKKISVKVTGSRPQFADASAQSPEVTVRSADTTTPDGTPTPSAPMLLVSEKTFAPSAEIQVSGEGFTPGETVSLYLHSDPLHLKDVTADAQGKFQTTVVIPSSAPAGSHHIVATGVTSKKEIKVAVTVMVKSTVPAGTSQTGALQEAGTPESGAKTGTSTSTQVQGKSGKSALASTGAESVFVLMALTAAAGAVATTTRRRHG